MVQTPHPFQPIHVGVDVDGVIADFNESFIKLVVEVVGKDLFPPRPFDIPTWDYPQHYGYTNAECSRVWEHIKKSSTFWKCLKPYKQTLEFLTTLKQMPVRTTFVTSRVGKMVQTQTEEFLRANGFVWPAVIISSNKGAVARRIELTHYVDDKNENCADVVKAVPGSRVFMLAQPWNQEQPGTLRITDLGVVLDAVSAALKTQREAYNVPAVA